MPNDYVKKEPTKAEKMIYELYVQQQQMEKAMWSTSTLVITLAVLTKQDPKAIAELMVNGDEKLREFSKQVNEAVSALEKEKHPSTHEATANSDGEHEYSVGTSNK
jgi:hypothetical protein